MEPKKLLISTKNICEGPQDVRLTEKTVTGLTKNILGF